MPPNIAAIQQHDPSPYHITSKMIESSLISLGESPFCIAVLSVVGDGTNDDKIQCLNVESVNKTFEERIAPHFKMKESLKEVSLFQFLSPVNQTHQQQLVKAVEAIYNRKEDRTKVRGIEILTLAEENNGFPIKKHFDWIVTPGPAEDDEDSSSSDNNPKKKKTVVLYGDPCNDQDLEQRAKDAELVDFFHNAPIALHWLSGEGIVLWANKREMDVLGYTPEEYIGQPIMKFCPDEEELVLEIFKQLGSGNTIKDVPVRFRTKEGKIVHLLIDSNVKYDEFGKFAHTRCFIRDDTGRKIHEAKAQLLLEETKRSLKMLDNFMSRSLHHVRTPLHILQSSVDLMAENAEKMKELAMKEKVSSSFVGTIEESQSLLQSAGEHIQNGVAMIDDISDLVKLDQQQELQLNPELIDLKVLGQEVFGLIDIPDDIEAALEFRGGGSTHLNTDKKYLTKVLRNLLDHCANSKDAEHNFFGQDHRHLSLIIGHTDNICIFQVVLCVGENLTSRDIVGMVDPNGRPAKEEPDDSNGGKKSQTGTADLPPIFQKYHQELLPEETFDYNAADGLRSKIEAGINSQRFDSLHVGLSLSYHLVSALGGDLRYLSRPNCRIFTFGIAHSQSELTVERFVIKRKTKSDGNSQSRFVPVEDAKPVECSKQAIVTQGATAMDPLTVLVVEDVPMCAKLLLKHLNRLNCSTQWAQNGQIAVDLVKENPSLYDLILMDIRMPVMDGIEATFIIKKELHCTTPVIALTGEAGEDIRNQCDALGFDGFHNKPLKREKLVSILQDYAAGSSSGQTVRRGPSQ